MLTIYYERNQIVYRGDDLSDYSDDGNEDKDNWKWKIPTNEKVYFMCSKYIYNNTYLKSGTDLYQISNEYYYFCITVL